MPTKTDEREMDFSTRKLPPYRFIGQWSQDDPADDEKFAAPANWSNYPTIMPEVTHSTPAFKRSWFQGQSREVLAEICYAQAAMLAKLPRLGIVQPPRQKEEVESKLVKTEAKLKHSRARELVLHDEIRKLRELLNDQRHALSTRATPAAAAEEISALTEANEKLKLVVATVRRELKRESERLAAAESNAVYYNKQAADRSQELFEAHNLKPPVVDFVRCGDRLTLPEYNGRVAARIYPCDRDCIECQTFTLTLYCHENRRTYPLGVRRGNVILLLEATQFPGEPLRGSGPEPDLNPS